MTNNQMERIRCPFLLEMNAGILNKKYGGLYALIRLADRAIPFWFCIDVEDMSVPAMNVSFGGMARKMKLYYDGSFFAISIKTSHYRRIICRGEYF